MDQRAVTRLMRFRRTVFVGLACYWCALFIATHIPLPALRGIPSGSDKIAHFVVYAGLSYLLALCYLVSRPMKLQHYLTVFAICAIYAAVDELLQGFVNRHTDFYDGIADSMGSVVGLVAFAITRHVLERTSSAPARE